MTFEEYCRLPGWNWSTIKLMSRSPRAVRWARQHADDGDTASRRWLRAIHAAVLEGERDYVVYDGVRRGKTYEAFAAANAGKDVLNVREADALKNEVRAVLEHPVAREVLASGEPEVTMSWTEDGLDMKGRLDWYDQSTGTLLDLKTSGTVDPRQVGSMVARMGWHGQLAHYAAGLRALGMPVERVLLLCAQGKDEQDVGVYELSPHAPDGALYQGAMLRDRYLAQLRECLERDEWPGAVPGVEDLILPVWAMDDDLEVE